MRAHLATAAWFWAAVVGVYFAVVMSGWTVVADHSGWKTHLPGAVAGAAVCAMIVWWGTRRGFAAENAICAGLTPMQRRAANRAARTGAVPDDPAVRAAAAALVRKRLADENRHRTVDLVLGTVLFVVCAVGVAAGQLWYLAGLVVFGLALITSWRSPVRLTRTSAGLESAALPAPHAAAGQPERP